MQIDLNYAPAYLHLGLVYLLRGENSFGKMHLEMALAKADGDAAILEQAERLLRSYFWGK
ncbi:MAG TPA: hypothetical protein VJ436_05605 [Anaerolineales bacterium]|nr:hypothetical protein [Anaerolineales bacterium]